VNNFFKRTLTAGAFVAVLLSATWYSQVSFTALFLVITILGLWEFYSLSEKDGNRPLKIVGTVVGAVLFISNSFSVTNGQHLTVLLLNLPFVFIIFVFYLF
jgi:CDP-diglyceride synthetase